MQIDLPVLLDTNILVYAANKSSPQHKAALVLRNAAARGEFVAFITPQILLEFFAIVTSPRRLGNAVSITAATKEVRTYQTAKHIATILPQANTHLHALELCERYNLSAQEIYDAYLVATALDNEVYTIISADTGMTRFREITTLNPFI